MKKMIPKDLHCRKCGKYVIDNCNYVSISYGNHMGMYNVIKNVESFDIPDDNFALCTNCTRDMMNFVNGFIEPKEYADENISSIDI